MMMCGCAFESGMNWNEGGMGMLAPACQKQEASNPFRWAQAGQSSSPHTVYLRKTTVSRNYSCPVSVKWGRKIFELEGGKKLHKHTTWRILLLRYLSLWSERAFLFIEDNCLVLQDGQKIWYENGWIKYDR